MKIKTRDMVLVALFTALTAVGGFLTIPLKPAPITLQTLFTLLAGVVLGPKLGALSQLVYVILGLMGVRVFAGFSGGPQTVFSPSFGFLIGFIFISYIVGLIIHKDNNYTLKNILFATILGSILVYFFGVPYMYLILNKVMDTPITMAQAIKSGCLIFLPGDFLKAIIAGFVGHKVLHRLPNLVEEK